MPPRNRQLQPTIQERAEMVTALKTLATLALKEMQWKTPQQWLLNLRANQYRLSN